MILTADVQDIENGTSAEITIIEKDKDGNDDEVATINGKVYNGKIEAKWKVKYTADDDDENSQKEMEEKGYTLPEYAFKIECDGQESEESEQLEVYAKFIRKITLNGKALKLRPCKILFADGNEITITTDEKGFIIIDEIPVGDVYIL